MMPDQLTWPFLTRGSPFALYDDFEKISSKSCISSALTASSDDLLIFKGASLRRIANQ